MEINAPKIEAELRALANGKEGEPSKSRMRIKVRLNNSQRSTATPTLSPSPLALRTRETDQGFDITFNPKRYRTEAKLEGHLNGLRQDIVWGS